MSKIECMLCHRRPATWFVKRKKDILQVGGGGILAYCKECFPKEKVDWAFPSALYYRYYSPQGIEEKTLKETRFEELIKKVEKGLELGWKK